IPIMDIQHLWLVKMIVELEQANKSTSSKERDEMFQKTIMEAVQYAKTHFQVEEILMKEFQFPELGRHFKTHRNFMEFISVRNTQKKDKLFPASIGLVNDLKEWLISHIAIEDKQLSLHLKTRSNEVEDFINMKKEEGIFRIPQSQIKFYAQIKNM
ncbi:MAG TPA: hemerythrin family protein, partial [Leptospiraceae bacterium]|nr:hemerythrin family protein [Leptospiraceae bacterium]